MAEHCCHHEHKRRKPFHHLVVGFLGFIIVENTAPAETPPRPPSPIPWTPPPRDPEPKPRKPFIPIVVGLLVFIILTVLLVWLILRPTYPRFVLEDATIDDFSISLEGCRVTTTFQVKLSSRNPNKRIGVYYDRVKVYASYRDQPITQPTLLPPTYQGHKDITVWSPCVYGNSVPIAPDSCDALTQDQCAGTVTISIKVSASIRWKVGWFITGKFHLNAQCKVHINLGRQNNSVTPAVPAIKYHLLQNCHVHV